MQYAYVHVRVYVYEYMHTPHMNKKSPVKLLPRPLSPACMYVHIERSPRQTEL